MHVFLVYIMMTASAATYRATVHVLVTFNLKNYRHLKCGMCVRKHSRKK